MFPCPVCPSHSKPLLQRTSRHEGLSPRDKALCLYQRHAELCCGPTMSTIAAALSEVLAIEESPACRRVWRQFSPPTSTEQESLLGSRFALAVRCWNVAVAALEKCCLMILHQSLSVVLVGGVTQIHNRYHKKYTGRPQAAMEHKLSTRHDMLM